MVDCFSLAGDVGFLGLLVVGGLDEAEDIIYRGTFLYLCDDEMPELVSGDQSMEVLDGDN